MELALSWAAVSAGAVAIVWLRLHYGRKDQQANAPQLDALQEQSEALSADVQSVYDELCDKIEQVNERLDFTERMLSQPKGEEPNETDTPSVATPL